MTRSIFYHRPLSLERVELEEDRGQDRRIREPLHPRAAAASTVTGFRAAKGRGGKKPSQPIKNLVTKRAVPDPDSPSARLTRPSKVPVDRKPRILRSKSSVAKMNPKVDRKKMMHEPKLPAASRVSLNRELARSRAKRAAAMPTQPGKGQHRLRRKLRSLRPNKLVIGKPGSKVDVNAKTRVPKVDVNAKTHIRKESVEAIIMRIKERLINGS